MIGLVCFLCLLSSSAGYRIALCFQGQIVGRANNASLASLRDNLMRGLSENGRNEIDVFVAVTYSRSRDRLLWERRLERAIRVRGVQKVQFFEQDESDIRSKLAESFDPEDRQIQEQILRRGGKAFCGPRLWMHRELHLCMTYIAVKEAMTARRYDFVVKSRPDTYWLCPHVSPSRLQWTRAGSAVPVVWVVDGQDYLGINDRHAFMTREAAEVYFGTWKMLQSLNVATFADKIFLRTHPLTAEASLLLTLLSLRTPGGSAVVIDRLPCCFFLPCFGTDSIAKEHVHKRGISWESCSADVLEFQQNYECSKPFRNRSDDAVQWVKYRMEYNQSRMVSDCLKQRARGNWTERGIFQCWCNGKYHVPNSYYSDEGSHSLCRTFLM